MKVKELIEQLGFEDPEAEVHIAYDYGDPVLRRSAFGHRHTTVAPKVRRVKACGVKYNEYYRMPQVVENDDAEDDPGADDAKPTVVLFATAR